jgi:hypothetical protein
MKFSMQETKQGLGQVQTTLHWLFNITVPAKAVGDFPEKLQIRVQTTGLPNADHQTTKVELQGHVINSAGKTVKNGELSSKFVEGVDAAVQAYFTKWDAARWGGDGSDTTGKQSNDADLKAEVIIQLLDPQDKPTQTYTLIGAMPKITNSSELAQQADVFTPDITWEYDDFHKDVGGQKW